MLCFTLKDMYGTTVSYSTDEWLIDRTKRSRNHVKIFMITPAPYGIRTVPRRWFCTLGQFHVIAWLIVGFVPVPVLYSTATV